MEKPVTQAELLNVCELFGRIRLLMELNCCFFEFLLIEW